MAGTPQAAGLLEPTDITVIDQGDEAGQWFDVAKHRCRCWFCPDCCANMGRKLRAKLEPILQTFSGLLLVTFTVDPSLFPSPKDAYFYMRDKRCLARTIKELWQRGFLHSRRYFYVVEWQKHTEQAHFHVLLDASFVPWTALLSAWSKYRPPDAGPVQGNRPAFGTVLISVPKFKGGFAHAASYVTKYLTKAPQHGFPAWVLDLGSETRVRRYSASRGFWGEPTERATHDAIYKPQHRSYRKRIGQCGDSVDVFESGVKLDKSTGELKPVRSWMGEIAVPFRVIAEKFVDPRARVHRRGLDVSSVQEVITAIEAAVGNTVQWRRGGPVKMNTKEAPSYSQEERWAREHDEYMRKFDKKMAQWLDGNFS